MSNRNLDMLQRIAPVRRGSVLLSCALLWPCLSGCPRTSGYSNQPLYTTQVKTVYVEMFKSRSFWRDVEYDLTDALAKRIEVDTPYKIVSSPDLADSQISGQILHIGQSLLTIERERGTALEKEVQIQAVVNWKNLKSGKLLIDNRHVSAAAGYAPLQNQSINYAARLAANNLAERIVELMEESW